MSHLIGAWETVNKEKDRDYLMDNTKALLIFLVTAVHLMAAVRGRYGSNPVIDGLMTIACSFHMSLFMMISGYFSKTVKRERITDSLLIYLTAQALLFLWHLLFTKRGSVQSFTLVGVLGPGFSMWYLASLILLRLFHRELAAAKHSVVVLALASVAVMGSKVDTALDEVAVKTIANALFFVIGMKLTPEALLKIRCYPKWVYYLLGGALVCLFYIIAFCFHWKDLNTLRLIAIRQISVDELDVGVTGYVAYAAAIIVSLLMSVVIVGLITEKKTIFSVFGKNSVTKYIGQAFVYLGVHAILTRLPSMPVFIMYITVVALSALCVAIFGNNWTASQFDRWIAFLRKRLFVS